MYILKMDKNKYLTITTRCPIREGENAIDNIVFLIAPKYEDFDLSTFTLAVKYVLPDKTKRCEILTLCDDLYKGYLKYTWPVYTDITSQTGNVTARVTLLKPETDENGNDISHILNTNQVSIYVEPVFDCNSFDTPGEDNRLDVIDQKILELQKISEEYAKIKADDIEIINGEIWLMSNGEKIGDPISGTSHEWQEY